MVTLDRSVSEAEQVEGWRAQQLEAAGYPVDTAYLLAADASVDLHVAADLLRHGCPLETAIRILT